MTYLIAKRNLEEGDQIGCIKKYVIKKIIDNFSNCRITVKHKA